MEHEVGHERAGQQHAGKEEKVRVRILSPTQPRKEARPAPPLAVARRHNLSQHVSDHTDFPRRIAAFTDGTTASRDSPAICPRDATPSRTSIAESGQRVFTLPYTAVLP